MSEVGEDLKLPRLIIGIFQFNKYFKNQFFYSIYFAIFMQNLEKECYSYDYYKIQTGLFAYLKIIKSDKDCEEKRHCLIIALSKLMEIQ